MSTKTVKTRRPLACHLTEKEVLTFSKELSSVLSEKARQDGELASFQSHARAKIKELDARTSQLSEKIYSEKEYRDTDCEWRYDFAVGTKALWRLDTNEQIDTEIIAEYEKQEEMSIAQSQQQELLPDAAPAQKPPEATQ